MGTSNNGRPIQENDKVMDDKANNKISLDFMMTAVMRKETKEMQFTTRKHGGL